MKAFFRNWKTSVAGLIGLGTVIVPVVAPKYAPLMGAIATAAASAGLILARDADKTSEQSGVSKP